MLQPAAGPPPPALVPERIALPRRFARRGSRPNPAPPACCPARARADPATTLALPAPTRVPCAPPATDSRPRAGKQASLAPPTTTVPLRTLAPSPACGTASRCHPRRWAAKKLDDSEHSSELLPTDRPIVNGEPQITSRPGRASFGTTAP